MSKFETARLGSDSCAKRTQRFTLVRARMALRLVDLITAYVALHRGSCSRGYKLSREGEDPKSL
jgi:hypothetical protein